MKSSFLFPEFFAGNSTVQRKIISSSSTLLILEVTSLVSGSIKLTVSCNGPYTLQVSGFSPLDFTYELLDVEDMERSITRRVVGNPLRGKAIRQLLFLIILHVHIRLVNV